MLRSASPSVPDLAGKVVVITGASAGVGRATALAAAEAGAALGLLARSEEGLSEVAEAARAAGARVLVLPLDVADAEAVREAARRVEAELGPIEVWINNAMATVFSPIADLAADEVRRVTEVTYLGYVHGTLAALEQMRPRGRGCLVQVGSALAFRGIPLQAPYCAAKHAIRGFTASLRAELVHEGSAIKVTEVHLPAVNTPQFDWARAHAERRPRPVGEPHEPEVAARAILHAAVHPRREYWLGTSTAQAILGESVWPSLMDKMMAKMAWEGQFDDEPMPSDQPDNLFAPVEGLHRTRGRFVEEAKDNAALLDGEAVRAGLIAAGALAFAALGFLAGRARR